MKMQSLQQTTKEISKVLAKNSPTILTGLGVAGLVSTAVMAVKATPKALDILEKELYERRKTSKSEMAQNVRVFPGPLEISGYFSKKEVVQLTWKCYIPAAIMGVVTVGCIIGANSINLKRNTALAGAYSLTEKALKEYQEKVVETIGEKKERLIKDEIAKDKIKANPVSNAQIIATGKGDTLCYDALSGRYFYSDMETIKSAINVVNKNMMSEMFIQLNDLYSEIGLEGTKLGDYTGWYIDDGLLEPNFSTQISDNGKPCLVMDFDPPKYSDRSF